MDQARIRRGVEWLKKYHSNLIQNTKNNNKIIGMVFLPAFGDWLPFFTIKKLKLISK